MILPSPGSVKNAKNCYALWTAVILNLLIYMMIFGHQQELKKYQIFDGDGVQVTGQIYLNYLKLHQAQAYFHLPEWLVQIDPRNKDHLEIVGSYAIRDAQFMNQIENMKTQGDIVEFNLWKSKMLSFIEDFKSEDVFTYGLHQNSSGLLNWITYQFSHNQFFHLISNVVFLIFVGCAVEKLVGSLMLIIIYLMGGVVGGFFFLNLGTHGAIPMIGASASISALLAFYGVWTFQKKVPFFYFFSPLPQHYGQLYLPGWVIFPVLLLSDLTHFLTLPDGLGAQVAHTAHLGGAFCGITFAFILRFLDNILTKTQLLKS